jgi:hypothetical protein
VLDSREEEVNRDINSIAIVGRWRLCLCGCRETMPALDPQGRQRYYILGHNRRHKKRDKYRMEIDKITDIEIARNIIYELSLKIEYLERDSI